MFSGSTHQLPYIRNYAEARAQWDKPFKTRSAKWSKFQRPLRSIAQHHYRLEAINPDEYIDVFLYSTNMARFYAPDANGHERRLYIGDGSITSKKFMADVLDHGGVDNYCIDTNGKQVMAPVYSPTCVVDSDGTRFSAEYCFTPSGLLDTSQSKHTKHWHKVITAEDRARRGDIRNKWAPFLDLMMYRLPEFEENVEFTNSAGRPFGASPIKFATTRKVQEMGKDLMCDVAPTNECIDAFVEFAQCTFDQIASKRGYEQKGFHVGHPWMRQTGPSSTYADLEKPITALQLRRTLSEKVVAVCGGLERSGYIEIPQFVAKEDMPKSNVYVSNTQPEVLSSL